MGRRAREGGRPRRPLRVKVAQVPAVKEMVMVLFELWSTMQCEEERLHLHLRMRYARGRSAARW